MLQPALRLPAVRPARLLLLGLALAAVQTATAQDSGPTVGLQGGRYGLGVTSSWPAYGVSGTLQLTDKITAEAVLGFFGTVSNFGGRGWYRFNRNVNYDLYGYAGASLYHWGNQLYDESVLGLGGGVGIEAGLATLLNDETFPPIVVNAEVGMAFADFEYYDFSSFVFGAGVHYRFGGR
jgi:hypothetical protein